MTPTDDWVDSVRNEYAAGRPIALLFDYDGTLTRIVSHPALAVVSEFVREYLRQLAAWDGVSIGVISSRGLADVAAKVDLEGLYYVGCGGGEIDLRGVRVDSPMLGEMRDLLDAAEGAIRQIVTSFAGIWIESKPRSFTVHYRGASPTTVEAFIGPFQRLMSQFRDLRHLSVCQAYEVSPVDGWDKGTAVKLILTTLSDDVLPVYFGDAENDLPGLAAVSEAGGVTVAVGKTMANAALYRLDSPEALEADLSRLCVSLLNFSLTREPAIGG